MEYINRISDAAWANKIFVLALSEFWQQYGVCDFYHRIPKTLKKDRQFKSALKKSNSHCAVF